MTEFLVLLEHCFVTMMMREARRYAPICVSGGSTGLFVSRSSVARMYTTQYKIPFLGLSRRRANSFVYSPRFRPRMRRASCMSFTMIVTRLAWIAQMLLRT